MLETVFKDSAADSWVKMSRVREQLAEGRDFFWLFLQWWDHKSKKVTELQSCKRKFTCQLEP
jgi:hypothetical protein